MNKMSGAEKMALLMCSNLKKYQPMVVCGGESLKKAFDDKGIDTYTLSFSKKNLLKTLKKLKFLINEKNIEILHCHDNTASLYGYMLKKIYMLDVKVISHIHNCYPWIKTGGINKKIDSIFRPKYDFNITCGSRVYDFYDKYAPYFNKNKTESLSNAMDIEDITNISFNDIENVRKEFNIPRDKKILGFIGRLSEQKGIVPFINEFAKNKKRFEDCKILLVGNGEQQEQVNDLISKLGINDMFILTGFQEDIYKFYPLIDVLFLPSIYEGLPMVLLEGMAFKKAVISMDVGSINELVTNETGLLIQAGNYKEFIDKLEKIKSNEDIAKRYALNGYKFVQKKYNIKCYVKNIESIYDNVLNG